MLGHLRRPEQWRRIAYTIILTSLPIAIYGLLQRADLDPLPWGGDVQRRIAGNMGNAIFVAAYLIMAFFLTLERLLEHLGRLATGNNSGRQPGCGAGRLLSVRRRGAEPVPFCSPRAAARCWAGWLACLCSSCCFCWDCVAGPALRKIAAVS